MAIIRWNVRCDYCDGDGMGDHGPCPDCDGLEVITLEANVLETIRVSSTPATHIEQRLEYLRTELRAERMSYGEVAELQSLAEHIAPGDVELLEAAGVPEDRS